MTLTICGVLLALSLYYTFARGLGDRTSIQFAQACVAVGFIYGAIRIVLRK